MKIKQATSFLWIFLGVLLVISILFPAQLVGTVDTIHWVVMSISFVVVLILEALLWKNKRKQS